MITGLKRQLLRKLSGNFNPIGSLRLYHYAGLYNCGPDGDRGDLCKWMTYTPKREGDVYANIHEFSTTRPLEQYNQRDWVGA